MPFLGHFSGNPKTEWLSDPGKPDREMRLLEDFSFTDPEGRVWRAPKGSTINGASIPRPLWASTGSPYTDDYRNASVVHDVAYDDPNIPRKDADKMFFYACIAGGCSILQAAKLYAGVRLGDWLSRVKKWPHFSRSMLLYRLPGQQEPQETELRAKYTSIAAEIDEKLDEKSSFEAVDAVVVCRSALSTSPMGSFPMVRSISVSAIAARWHRSHRRSPSPGSPIPRQRQPAGRVNQRPAPE